MTTMTSELIQILTSLGELWLPLFLDALLKGMVLLGVAAGASVLLRRASAASRHLVWTLGLTALLLLPALRAAAPALKIEAPVVPTEILATLTGATAAPHGAMTAGEPAEPLTSPRESVGSVGSVGEVATGGVGESLGATAPSGSSMTALVSGEGGPDTGTAGTHPASLDRTARAAGAPSIPALLLALWIAGAGVLLGRLVLGVVRVRLLARNAGEVTDPELLGRMERLAARLGLKRRVRLLTGPGAPVPMTWGLFRPVLFLPAEARTWTAGRVDHVLLHEMAHVKRRDHQLQILGEVALALHWMNPLAWLAARRSRIERELACDDRVLAAGCRPSGYARDLLEVARTLRRPGSPVLAAVPMARASGLADRLRAILDPARPRQGPGGARTALSVTLALGLVLPLAALSPVAPRVAEASAPLTGSGHPVEAESEPGSVPMEIEEVGTEVGGEPGSVVGEGFALPVQELCVFRNGRSHSTRVNVDDDRARIEWSTDDCSVDVEVRGAVEFAPDDRSVTRVPRGGLFDLEEEVGRSRRRVRMEAGAGGAPEIEYWVDGDRRPFDREGQEWLAAILPELFRHTTINAEARARRILEERGVDGLLREIEGIRSDHVARTYFQHLLALAELDESQVREVLRIAGQRLGSDHHRAELLLALVEERGLEPGLQGAYLEAARGIGSDHHHRRVLERLLQAPTLDPATLERILRASRDLGSDHHQAELLLGVVRVGPLSERGREAFLAALEDLDSDHHHRRVLEGFLDQGRLSPSELAQVLEMTRGIGSDHHLAEILVRVGRDHDLGAEARNAYLRAASGIGSDHHLRRTLEALLERSDPGDDQVSLVLELAGRIGSGHHRASLLEAVARGRRLSGSLREDYLRLARDIGSRTHRNRALAALVEGP